MKKVLKLFTLMIAIIICFTNASVFAKAKAQIPAATSDFYVNDFAGIFTDDEKTNLMSAAVTLADEHDGIQVVISTINSLEGDTIESYAVNMYNEYKIGKDSMGLLILLSVEDRKIRVEVGKSMEAYINDSKAGRFIDDYAIPYLKNDEFSDGLINLQKNLIDEILSCVQEETDNKNIAAISDGQNLNVKSDFNLANFAVTLVITFCILGLIFLIIFFIRKRIRKVQNLKSTIDNLQKEIGKNKVLYNNTIYRYNLEVDSLNEKIKELSNKNGKTITMLKDVQEQLSNSKYRYTKAITLHPNLDKDVDALIEKEIYLKDTAMANEVDNTILIVIKLDPSKDIVSKIKGTLTSYSKLTEKQKSYVKSDINKLNALYDASCKLLLQYERKIEEEKNKKLALTASNAINSIISHIIIGQVSNLGQLEKANEIYKNLSSNVKSYFDQSTLNKLRNLIEDALKDKKRKDEEDEERERLIRLQEDEQQRRSRDDIDSSTSYSGFDGSSDGSGASRNF